MISRRAFCGALPGLMLAVSDGDLEVRDLRVPGTFSKRMTLFLPKHLGAGQKVKLLVLLHGLGETGDERAGAYAWFERYGLGTSYARLRRPPVTQTAKRGDLSVERMDAINAELAKKPFSGIAMACPYLPNVHARGGPALDDVARWITETVVPQARAESAMAAETEIDGCSLGGYVSLEVFLRKPEAFAACGGVQSAIGEANAPRYAQRLADALGRVGNRSLYFATSTKDAFRKGNEALSRELEKRGVAHTFRLLPGPHDQPWLREAGTLDMLHWHAQR